MGGGTHASSHESIELHCPEKASGTQMSAFAAAAPAVFTFCWQRHPELQYSSQVSLLVYELGLAAEEAVRMAEQVPSFKHS